MVMGSKNINSDLYFAFSELFWPTFIEYENFIFLEQNFSKEKFNELIVQDLNVEVWMNLLTTDPFFEKEENQIERAESLAKTFVKTWKSKLKVDFPDKIFVVEYLFDDDVGDCGVTFYQKQVE